ncbi:MAG: type I-D CRISPR-associated helicase Cas3' [Halorhabdus sp.]
MKIDGASLATEPPKYGLADGDFDHARAFQNRVVEWVHDGTEPVAVLRAPTGAGKTATFHELIETRSVPLLVYPTNALLRQQRNRFSDEDVDVAVLNSETLSGHGRDRVEGLIAYFDEYEADHDAVVTNPDILQAAIQDLYAGGRSMRIFEQIDAVVYDEFHFYSSLAASGLLLQLKILAERHPDQKILLASATPNEDFVDFVVERLGLDVCDINASYVSDGDQFRQPVEMTRHEETRLYERRDEIAESLADKLAEVGTYDEPHAVLVFNSVRQSNDFHRFLAEEYPEVFEHAAKDNGFDTNDERADLDEESFYVLNTTSKGEVGLDYDIRTLHMETPKRAGPFLQRFGRAGRESEASVHVYGLGQGPWGDDVTFPKFEEQIYKGLGAYEDSDGRQMPLSRLADLVGFRAAYAIACRESGYGWFDEALRKDFEENVEQYDRWRGFIARINDELDEVSTGFEPGKYTPKDPEAKLLGFTKACFAAFRGLRGRSVQATVRYPRGDRLALTTYGLTTTLRYYDIDDVEYDEYEPILTLRPKPDDSLSVVTARLPEYDTEPRQYDRPSTEIEEELQQKMHREVDRVELSDEFEVSTETLHLFFQIVRITNAVVPETITTAEYEIEVETQENSPPSLNVQHRRI